MGGFFSLIWKVPMLVKEAVIKVARELKKQTEPEFQDSTLLDGYPDDLSEAEIKQAMLAIASVSDVMLKLY